MNIVKIIVILAVLGGGGYWAYMTFVKKEEVKLPDVDLSKVKAPDVEIDAFAKAEGYFRAAKYDEAITNYKLAIQENKDAANVAVAHFHLAQAYERSKQYPQAIQAYGDALKKYPNHEFADRTKKALEKLKLERQ